MSTQSETVQPPIKQVFLFMAFVGCISAITPVGILLGMIPLALGNLLVTMSGFFGVVYFGFVTPNRDAVSLRVLVVFGLYAAIPALHLLGFLGDFNTRVLYAVGLAAISLLIIIRWWTEAKRIGEEPKELVKEALKRLFNRK